MQRTLLFRLGLAGLLAGGIAGVARSQVSIEEAERRLRAKSAVVPSTAPVSEVDRLREENRRLRQRVADLQQEVVTLKEILSHVTPTPTPAPGAATQPAGEAVVPMRQALLGRWRGGDNAAGSAFILQFDPDGSYKQTFVFNNQKASGQYRVFEDNVLEMWEDKKADDAPHNHYRITVTPDNLTMAPVAMDGSDAKSVRVWSLRRTD